jgi:hypothetical protein
MIAQACKGFGGGHRTHAFQSSDRRQQWLSFSAFIGQLTQRLGVIGQFFASSLGVIGNQYPVAYPTHDPSLLAGQFGFHSGPHDGLRGTLALGRGFD